MGATRWVMPGRSTRASSISPASQGSFARPIPVGSGMRTVPANASPRRSTRQGTSPSAPETSSRYSSDAPSARPSCRARYAPSDMAAFPQNSPPII